MAATWTRIEGKLIIEHIVICVILHVSALYPQIYRYIFICIVFVGCDVSNRFLWIIHPYPAGLLHWHWGNRIIAPMPIGQYRRIWLWSSSTKPLQTTAKVKPYICFLGCNLLNTAQTMVYNLRSSHHVLWRLRRHFHGACLWINLGNWVWHGGVFFHDELRLVDREWRPGGRNWGY